jgi:hypothetical protein
MVATREGRIVGAVWYADAVNEEQAWYTAVRSRLILPARLTVNMFVVPGEKAAAWAMAKYANDRLAAAGVRSIVGVIQTTNKPSILVSRMLGGRIAAHQSVRYWFGVRRTTVAASAE